MANRATSAPSDVQRLMADGHQAEAIADRLGLALSSTRKLMKDADPNYKPTLPRPDFPFGMTDASNSVRSRLGYFLRDLIDDIGDRRQVSALVGINKNEIVRALQRPYTHNWTLSQMCRLHTALGIEFDMANLASRSYVYGQ